MLGKSKFIAAGVLVFVLLVAGIGGTIAFAQGPNPTAPANAWGQLYLQTLAQKLGTTVEKLQQAMTDARKDATTQGVKQGLLTQAQADRMLGNTARASITSAGLDAAAKALGMSTADLTTALKSKTLLDLANDKKVDVTTLRTAIADAEKAAIDQAVKNGTLTQAQADTMKANLKPENIDLNRGFLGFRGRGEFGRMNEFGGRGGPGGMGAPFGMRGGKR